MQWHRMRVLHFWSRPTSGQQKLYRTEYFNAERQTHTHTSHSQSFESVCRAVISSCPFNFYGMRKRKVENCCFALVVFLFCAMLTTDSECMCLCYTILPMFSEVWDFFSLSRSLCVSVHALEWLCKCCAGVEHERVVVGLEEKCK